MMYNDDSYRSNGIGLSHQKDLDHVKIQKRLEHLWSMVGNTPMLELHYTYLGQHRKIYVKCEHYNLTGSIKDRMALYILQRAYELGTVRPGDTILEASSGNSGIAFSAIGRALGHKVNIIMPDFLNSERIDLIKSLGAEVTLVPKEQGDFLGNIALSEKIASEQAGIFLPRQFDNCFNSEAHERTTGREIWMQLQSLELTPDAFVGGIGTGGTVMGVGQYLKKRNPAVCIHPLEPKESPTLSTGSRVGSHRIQGIFDEFIPPIVDLKRLDEVMQASDGDSILMAQKIARQLGLAVGISSGANLIGAILLQEQFGGNAVVVTVFPDSNKKYLSSDLVKNEPVLEEYVSREVEFIDYIPVKR